MIEFWVHVTDGDGSRWELVSWDVFRSLIVGESNQQLVNQATNVSELTD